MKPIAGRHPSKHPIWRADELAASQGQTVPTGDALLDAQLPGGGWPVGALIEVLQAHTGHNDWRLLLPALVQTEGVLVLVGAPHAPFAPGLAGQGLNPARLLCVNTRTPAARMWAAEQALRCQDVAAVLAWLPQARADSLRRLQISAAEHRKVLFVMRPARAQHESSPAVLRVITSTALGGDALLVNILKRRGPPLEQALTLVARPVRLGTLLALGKNARGAEKEGKAGETGAAAKAKTWGRIAITGSRSEAKGSVDRALTPILAFAAAPVSPAPAPVAELLDFPHPPPEHSHALDRAAA